MDDLKKRLEQVTTLDCNEVVCKSLADAIAPHMQLLCLLPMQEANFVFYMLGGLREPMSFDSHRMEDMHGRHGASVKALVFPTLYKKNNSNVTQSVSVIRAHISVAM